jgi:Holliday junction resolvasome RuvABC ATP-dependent DNA helicase subunit
LWDKVVYDREIPVPKKKIVPPEGTGDFVKTFTTQKDLIDELDATDRPQQKTAMLYGPPGLGKTTLAHVVATHAGYNFKYF